VKKEIDEMREKQRRMREEREVSLSWVTPPQHHSV